MLQTLQDALKEQPAAGAYYYQEHSPEEAVIAIRSAIQLHYVNQSSSGAESPYKSHTGVMGVDKGVIDLIAMVNRAKSDFENICGRLARLAALHKCQSAKYVNQALRIYDSNISNDNDVMLVKLNAYRKIYSLEKTPHAAKFYWGVQIKKII